MDVQKPQGMEHVPERVKEEEYEFFIGGKLHRMKGQCLEYDVKLLSFDPTKLSKP